MEINVGITTLKELPKPIQKLLKSRYPELNLHYDSVFILPGFGSGHDGDYILIVGDAALFEIIGTQEAFDEKIDEGVENGELKKLANLFSPAVWTALGHEYHGPAKDLDKLFYPDYDDGFEINEEEE